MKAKQKFTVTITIKDGENEGDLKIAMKFSPNIKMADQASPAVSYALNLLGGIRKDAAQDHIPS